MQGANFDLVDQITQQVKEPREAKARAELEVNRLSKLCAFKDTVISSFEADIERVDSLQLHSAELLDMIAESEVDSVDFEHQSQSFTGEVLALTTRANTFEFQVQVALEQDAEIRLELHETAQELVRLRESSKKSTMEKAEVELELEKVRFCEDVREDEKIKLEAAHMPQY